MGIPISAIWQRLPELAADTLKPLVKGVRELKTLPGLKMVDLEGGFFVQGSHAFQDAPPRWVAISPFSIGQTAVTEGQYAAVMGRAVTKGSQETYPATYVSWQEAPAFMHRLNEGLRLPTEAEREYATRGRAIHLQGVMREEGADLRDVENYVDGRFENFFTEIGGRIFVDPKDQAFKQAVREVPVYGFKVYATPNGAASLEHMWVEREALTHANFGPGELKGMSGGVWEWTGDTYSDVAYKMGSPVLDPLNVEEGPYRVLRGGSWYDFQGYARAAYRIGNAPGYRYGRVGFRVAASPPGLQV